jgi:hypothetical protein
METVSKFEDEIMKSGVYNSDLDFKIIEYDPNGKPNSQRAIDFAANSGLKVLYPAADELFIDIDNEHSFQLFLKQMDILKKYVGVRGDTITPSKSGFPKRHIVVYLEKPITEVERVALQAMMGSDRVRELLGYVQAKNNDPHPTLFLERKS